MLRVATGRRASAGGPFAARDGARSTGPTPVASAPTRCTRGGASMPLVRDTVPAIRASTALAANALGSPRSEEHTSELQSHSDLVCRLLLEKKKKYLPTNSHTNQSTAHATNQV